MKVSLVIITALVLNTTLLIAEPLSALAQEISPWFLLLMEGVLLLLYLLYKWVVRITGDFMLNLGYLDVFVDEEENKHRN